MKKNMLLGMAAVMALSMVAVQPVLAAPGKPVDVYRERMKDTNTGKGQIKMVNDQSPQTARKSLADGLERVSKDADSNELVSALGKTIDLGNNAINANTSKVTLESIGRVIAKKSEQLAEVNRNNLDAATKLHHETLEKAVKVSAAFLSLAARSSRIDSKLDAGTARRVEAFEKQLALIPEVLTKMNSADMETHIKVMEKAIEMKVSAETRGDVAFENALKAIYGENVSKKLAELLGCKM